ncbi:hypothetical protein CWE12_09160 [Aliidiomarina sedimenti]|uniref:DUF2914 domain-containing protein n=1 Tax=Aliidiomarina sedimenti TaxID=1933879 RepID=A0ABY0BY05_9GAMM|nr:DUF2914 domain-containing protein [Aliidiomarina sedimenti]RUO29147.1 hypothetical protein CWE12_09160 [Aliidiomarina sedimenti]
MMLNKLATISLSLLFLFQFSAVTASETDHVTLNEQYVERAVLTTAVENREPVDDLGSSYTHSGEEFDRLAFFTHMVNHDGRGITHRWYRNGELDAEIELAVGSNSWRTYSTKQISHLEEGDWTVRVVNDGGDELVEYNFQVQR